MKIVIETFFKFASIKLFISLNLASDRGLFMTWQDRVRALMEKSRYSSISELAGAAGVSQGSLNMAMNGKHTPKSVTMDKIAKVLGTTSQFILYGEHKAPSKSVPLLRTSNVGLWLMGQLKMEDCSIIVAPGEMGDKGFAWVCDVSDMSPVFPKGAVVFFDCIESSMLDSLHDNYVMAAMVHRSHDNAGIKTGKEPNLFGSLFNNVINITAPVFREVVNTSTGPYLIAKDSGYEKMPLEPMELIAIARYCLIKV